MRSRRICSFLLVFVLAVSVLWVFPGTAAAETSEDRLITITLHAGEYGCFGDESVREKEVVCFRHDYFIFDDEPDVLTDTRIFLGWASSPDAAEPDVFSRESVAGDFGTDIYAVWGTTGTVLYNCHEGYIEAEGSEYSHLLMTYDAGSNFKVIVPENHDDRLRFGGWYSEYYASGFHYTEKYVIKSPEIEVIATWLIDDSKISPLELDTPYHLDSAGSGDYYWFIPETTGAYRIYTYGMEDTSRNSYIRLLDGCLKEITDSTVTDMDGNCELCYQLDAGTEYYFQVREAGGRDAAFDFMLTTDESVEVIFHANTDNESIFFDYDKECKDKTIHVARGTDLKGYNAGLTVNDTKHVRFLGWADSPDAFFPSSFLYAWTDMEVYAVYEEIKTITMDANGGYFSLFDSAKALPYTYEEGDLFTPDYDPRTDDPSLGFCGWATTPDAEAPDIELGKAKAEDLPDTVYAVYAEKVIVTFDAGSGYFFYDTEQHVRTYITGNGHCFEGTSLKNQNQNLVPYGWMDQNGVFIPYTVASYYDYHFNGNTYLTAVWDRRVFLNANGGYFTDLEFTEIMVDYRMDSPFECPSDAMLWNPDPTKRLAGWSTSPDGDVIDVTEGKTPVNGLETVYAVWEEFVYFFEEGDGAEWDESSGGDLKFVIKRAEEDELTYPSFEGIEVDGNAVGSSMYSAEEGSLILTLKPAYLRTLNAGDHELTVIFTDASVKGSFSVVREETPDARPNPKTGVTAMQAVLSLIAGAGVSVYMFRRRDL